MAGFEMSVKADIKQVERMLTGLEKKEVPKAAAAAINRTAAQVRTEASKQIRIETGLPAKVVNKAVLVSVKAKLPNLTAIVKAHPKGVNLIEFVTKGKRKAGSFKKREGVRANAWGKTKTYRGTFIGSGKNSGKALVFTRTSSKASPIKTVKGPSIPNTFIKGKIEKAMQLKASSVWSKRFTHELNRRLKRIRGW